jgi:hypothetical protein
LIHGSKDSSLLNQTLDNIDSLQKHFRNFKTVPKNLEAQAYADFERHQRFIESLGASVAYQTTDKHQPVALDQEDLDRAKEEMREIRR